MCAKIKKTVSEKRDFFNKWRLLFMVDKAKVEEEIKILLAGIGVDLDS